MASGGGKRKIGHNKKRSISMQSYVATGRLLTNKKRRIAKEKRRQDACAALQAEWTVNGHHKCFEVKRQLRLNKRNRY